MKEEFYLDQQLCRWLLLSLDRLEGTEMVTMRWSGRNMPDVSRSHWQRKPPIPRVASVPTQEFI